MVSDLICFALAPLMLAVVFIAILWPTLLLFCFDKVKGWIVVLVIWFQLSWGMAVIHLMKTYGR